MRYLVTHLKNYPTKKLLYDDIGSIDLMDMSDYKSSNIKGLRTKFVGSEYFLKHIWCVLLKKALNEEQLNFQNF